MSVKVCYICQDEPQAVHRYGQAELDDGDYCPICYQPTCRRHLSVVRWRWRENGELDSALACKNCVRTYAHRSWDVFHRDWIT
ncbi:MAG: hypothetical protein R6X34_12940 [Chloroflexota bacterium]|jgi:hypothetical protein